MGQENMLPHVMGDKMTEMPSASEVFVFFFW